MIQEDDRMYVFKIEGNTKMPDGWDQTDHCDVFWRAIDYCQVQYTIIGAYIYSC